MVSHAKELARLILPADLRRLLGQRHFLWMKRTKGFDVPPLPAFDAPSTRYFLDRIESSRIYLEYGSGGSTRVAEKHVDTLVSVESDKYYLRSVAKRLEHPKPQQQVLIHANIGPTEQWGDPIFQRLTRRRIKRWADYSEAPWRWLDEHGLQPDTILVDGRFRAACALASALHIREPDSCRILFDDYAERPYYHIVENYCERLEMVGRMAILRPKAELDRDSLLATLRECQRDYR